MSFRTEDDSRLLREFLAWKAATESEQFTRSDDVLVRDFFKQKEARIHTAIITMGQPPVIGQSQ